MLQMVDEKKYFLYAAIITFTLLVLFFLGFFYLFFHKSHLQTYALKKDKYISISLATTPLKTTQKKQKKSIKVKKKKKVIRKSVDPTQSEDIDSLFENVWTKKINPKVVKKKRVDTKRIAEIQKSIDLPKKSSNKVQKGKKEVSKKSSTAKEVNEYLAKIHAIVYDHFFPPPNTQGLYVKAVLELSALGKMIDFRILNYSASEALNQEVDSMKERMRNVLFPASPDHKKRAIIIYLKPENKE